MSAKNCDKMVLGNNCVVSTDSEKTGRNNHILVIGGSGSGKTHSVVEPTLMETNESSIVIADPKGRLLRKYGAYMESKGYHVQTLDFNNPRKSPVGYDPLQMLRRSTNCLYGSHSRRTRFHRTPEGRDVMSLAHLIVRNDPNHQKQHRADPFWDDMSEVLLSSLISLLMEYYREKDQTLADLTSIVDHCTSFSQAGMKHMDSLFERVEQIHKNHFAARQFRKVRQAPEKTLGSIFVTLSSFLGRITTDDLCEFMKREEQISPVDLLREKTALFVQCSDSDSTLYFLVNVFYTQMMQYLFRLKDLPEFEKSRPVRFILDDFATNVVVPDMPKWISIMRERDISVMLILQSVTQLEGIYGECDARTIISNCDNIVYLRSNDLKTSVEFSERLDVPAKDLLYTPVGREYVLLAGKEPIRTERFDIRNHEDYSLVYSDRDIKDNAQERDADREERGVA